MRVDRIRPRTIPSEPAKVAQLREIGERLRALQSANSLRFTSAGNELSLHAENLRQALLDGRGYSLANLAFEVGRVAHFTETGVIAPGSEIRLTDWLDKLQSPTAFYGAQWGEEGKRQVEYSYGNPVMAVRFLGGPNAGSAINVNHLNTSILTSDEGLAVMEKAPLRHFPGGILNPSVERVLLAPGATVGLATAVQELRNLAAMQKADRLPKELRFTPDRIAIDPRCHVVLPHHAKHSYYFRDGGVGTEETGTGATMAGIYGRQGDVTMADLAAGGADLDVAVHRSLMATSGLIDALMGNDGERRLTGRSEEFDHEKVIAAQKALLAELRQYVEMPAFGVTEEIAAALRANKVVHFLATQGFALDPQTGIRPYVTSSHTGTAGLLTGLGLPDALELIPEHMAVVPAYLTLKGGRPFVTEIRRPDLAQRLRISAGQFDRKMEAGHLRLNEKDKKHRVGYLDAVMLAHYLGLNHVTQAALTKLDVWDGYKKVKVGVGYDYEGPERDAVRRAFGEHCQERGSRLRVTAFSPVLDFLRGARPVYKEFPWDIQVKGVKSAADLPKEARALISFLEQATDVPFHVVKTGPEPEAMFLRNI